MKTITLSDRQVEIIRDALHIAYIDDDAPIYETPDGEVEVAQLLRTFAKDA